MFHTGALENPTSHIVAQHDKRPKLTLLALFAFIFFISAILNNTPVVVMFLPILVGISAKIGIASSRLLMPLSFVTILAGSTTLIGSSTNILVGQSLGSNSPYALGFFGPTPIGLILAAVGLVYLILFSARILPERVSKMAASASSGKQYIMEIDVGVDHPLAGEKAVAGMFPPLHGLTVQIIQRGYMTLLPPFDDVELRPGDHLVLSATRGQITDLVTKVDAILDRFRIKDSGEDQEGEGKARDMSITEIIVAPGSRLIGRSVGQSGFEYQSGCRIIGIQRRRNMNRQQLRDIRLETGDVLLVIGSPEALIGLRSNRDVMALEWSIRDLPKFSHARRALMIFAAVVITASTGLLPIGHAAFAGALGMVMTGCLNIRQAARAIDREIFLLIGAAFAMGTAMQATGGGAFIAQLAVSVFAPGGPVVLLSALFLIVAILTNLLSNNATSVLFAPIAINSFFELKADPRFAGQLGDDPTLFLLTVLFAANCSFVTPMSYQTNLLVLRPGSYQFMDFVRLGLPLALLIWLTYTMILVFLFHF